MQRGSFVLLTSLSTMLCDFETPFAVEFLYVIDVENEPTYEGHNVIVTAVTFVPPFPFPVLLVW